MKLELRKEKDPSNQEVPEPVMLDIHLYQDKYSGSVLLRMQDALGVEWNILRINKKDGRIFRYMGIPTSIEWPVNQFGELEITNLRGGVF